MKEDKEDFISGDRAEKAASFFFMLSIFGTYLSIWELPPLVEDGTIGPKVAMIARAIFVGLFIGNIGHAINSFFIDVTKIRLRLENK